MKLCFSTIGCPDWSLKEIVATAKDLGYSGIEIRSVGGEVDATRMREFTDDFDKTVALLNRTGIKIAMLSTNCALANHNDDTAVERATAYVELAKKLGVEFIRVMSTDRPYFDGGDIELCKKRYTQILDYAKDSGVTVLMETNGLFLDSKTLADFIDEAGEGAGVLWDTHHPYRYNDEPISVTLKNLGSRIKYVHLKDSVIEKGKVAYKLMGYGDIPLEQIIGALKDVGYDGYYTFEWVKLWNKDLVEDGGIVFANYANYMSRFN